MPVLCTHVTAREPHDVLGQICNVIQNIWSILKSTLEPWNGCLEILACPGPFVIQASGLLRKYPIVKYDLEVNCEFQNIYRTITYSHFQKN
jgi:hypothetical protein